MDGVAESVVGVLVQPFTNPLSRTFWPGLLSALILTVFAGWMAGKPRAALLALLQPLSHPSARLDLQLLLSRQLLRLIPGGAGLSLTYSLSTHGVRLLDGQFGPPPEMQLPAWLITTVYSMVLFLAWDASRFYLHRAMHRYPRLWAIHQVHHSAERLNPLTFHRVHPIESLLYSLRGALVTSPITILFFYFFRDRAIEFSLWGVPALGVTLNVLTGNLRHSEVYLRFPRWLETWWISPAQHQVHHSAEVQDFDRNFGTWLAVWDRLGGSLALSHDRPPARFGLPAGERNHSDDLLSAWIGPLRGLIFGTGLSCLVLAALPTHAAEEEVPGSDNETTTEEEEKNASNTQGMEILVYDARGAVRVAGSAARIGEEDLERMEYNDIGRVVQQMPGVSVRNEDGYGLRPNIGIRGANSDRSAKITLMEDGILLAPAPYAAPAAYYFPMSTRLVGVELFKGPAATRHGPHTVGGAINVLTRTVPKELESGLDIAGGPRLSAKGHGWVGVGDATKGLLMEGVHLQTRGFKELNAGDPTGFSRSELMLKGRLAPAAGHELGLKLGYGRELSHETYLGLSPDDLQDNPYLRYPASENDLMQWDRTQAELRYGLRPATGLDVEFAAYHHYLSRAWTKLNRFEGGPDLHDLLLSEPTGSSAQTALEILRGQADSTTDEQILQIGTNDRRFHAAGVQGIAHHKIAREQWSSMVELGVRLHFDDIQRLHTEDPYWMRDGHLLATGGPTATLLDSHSTARALAAWLHEDLQLGRFSLLPGARVEHITTNQTDAPTPTTTEVQSEPVTRTVVLPGLGSMVRLGETVYLFGGVHRGFSPVAPGEPKSVRPEQSWAYEAGARTEDREGPLEWNAELVGFLNDYTNLVGQCTLSGGCLENTSLDRQYNAGAVKVWGLESMFGLSLPLGGTLTLPIDLSYTLTRSAFQTDFVSEFPQFGVVEAGDQLPSVPLQQASGRISLVHSRFDLGFSGTYQSQMLDLAGTLPASDPDAPGLIPALFLLDTNARFHIRPGVAAYLTTTNLLGNTTVTSFRPFGGRTAAPRQLMVGLKLGKAAG